MPEQRKEIVSGRPSTEGPLSRSSDEYLERDLVARWGDIEGRTGLIREAEEVNSEVLGPKMVEIASPRSLKVIPRSASLPDVDFGQNPSGWANGVRTRRISDKKAA
ncbi:MAG: hypothetical protein Q7R44_00185 [bacterium]|nr:hypothetical protein [bacterium]